MDASLRKQIFNIESECKVKTTALRQKLTEIEQSTEYLQSSYSYLEGRFLLVLKSVEDE